MDGEYIRERITQLRVQKGVSEYKMSYQLGHSRGYVNNISSGKTLPSMAEFLAICDYFEITPRDFFSEEIEAPSAVRQLTSLVSRMSSEDIKLIIQLVRRLTEE